MADIIDDGWLWLYDASNALKVQCERITWDVVITSDIIHYEGPINLNIPIIKQYILVVAQGIILDTHTKYSNFADYITDWMAAGEFTLKIQRNIGGDFIEIDGDNTAITVVTKNGIKGAEKISKGSQQIYFIKTMLFEQAG